MKLIPKDAVMAEIESLLDKGKYHDVYDCAYRDGNNGALYALKGKLDTLEVKEVDLETEIEEQCNKVHLLAVGKELRSICKHFFELGLNASNPLTWQDIDWIVGEAVCRVSEDSEAEQICKEVLKRFKDYKERKEK